jgi:hypothetical protein
MTTALAISNSGFTLRSVPGGSAVISASGSSFSVLFINGDNLTLYGLEVNGGGTKNCVSLGYGGESNAAAWANDDTLDHVRLHDCGNDSHEHAVYAEFTNRLHIVDSYLFADGGYGIQFYPSAENSLVDYTVIDGNARGSGWSGNVTFAGEAPGGEYSLPHGSLYNVIRYSLITFSTQNYNVESYFPSGSLPPVGNEVAFSCLFGAPSGNFDGSNGYTQHDNRAVDPLYTDRSAHNYRLRAGSPCAGWGPR